MAASEGGLLRVGEEFDCFNDLETRIHNFGKESNVQWIKSDCGTVGAANRKLKNQSTSRYLDKFVYRYVRFSCKHGGRKHSSTSKGSRPNQRSFKMDCPANIYASVDRKKNKMIIQTFTSNHNHEVDAQLYHRYPEQRRLDEGTLSIVKEMLQMKVKVLYLQDHIHSKGTNLVSIKDIHNIRTKMRTEKDGLKSEEQLLIDTLAELGSDDPGAHVSIQTTSIGELESLLFVTSDMKTSFDLYPEVLLMDGTYRINKYRMPLYTFIVEDGNGNGRVVGFCFVASEKKLTIEMMLSEMTKVHELSKVKTVIIDKDFNELAALKKVMPIARIQLCKFHVMQAMNREVRKLKLTDRDSTMETVRKIVFAKSKKSFDKYKAELEKDAPKQFVKYFKNNWAESAELWAGHETNTVINLGNTTNNRLESLNQKIKGVLHRNMTITEAVKGLLLLVRGMKQTLTQANFNKQMKIPVLATDDPSVRGAAQHLTSYAMSFVQKEIEAARKRKKPGKKRDNCCILQTTMGLPCRHVFSERLFLQQTPLFRVSDVLPRWRAEYETATSNGSSQPQNGQTVQSQTTPTLSTRQVVCQKPRPKSKEEKYRNMIILFKSMADLASNDGTKAFTEKMEVVQKLYDTWKKGENGVLVNLDNHEMEDRNGVDGRTHEQRSTVVGDKKNQRDEDKGSRSKKGIRTNADRDGSESAAVTVDEKTAEDGSNIGDQENQHGEDKGSRRKKRIRKNADRDGSSGSAAVTVDGKVSAEDRSNVRDQENQRGEDKGSQRKKRIRTNADSDGSENAAVTADGKTAEDGSKLEDDDEDKRSEAKKRIRVDADGSESAVVTVDGMTAEVRSEVGHEENQRGEVKGSQSKKRIRTDADVSESAVVTVDGMTAEVRSEVGHEENQRGEVKGSQSKKRIRVDADGSESAVVTADGMTAEVRSEVGHEENQRGEDKGSQSKKRIRTDADSDGSESAAVTVDGMTAEVKSEVRNEVNQCGEDKGSQSKKRIGTNADSDGSESAAVTVDGKTAEDGSKLEDDEDKRSQAKKRIRVDADGSESAMVTVDGMTAEVRSEVGHEENQLGEDKGSQSKKGIRTDADADGSESAAVTADGMTAEVQSEVRNEVNQCGEDKGSQSKKRIRTDANADGSESAAVTVDGKAPAEVKSNVGDKENQHDEDKGSQSKKRIRTGSDTNGSESASITVDGKAAEAKSEVGNDDENQRGEDKGNAKDIKTSESGNKGSKSGRRKVTSIRNIATGRVLDVIQNITLTMPTNPLVRGRPKEHRKGKMKNKDKNLKKGTISGCRDKEDVSKLKPSKNSGENKNEGRDEPMINGADSTQMVAKPNGSHVTDKGGKCEKKSTTDDEGSKIDHEAESGTDDDLVVVKIGKYNLPESQLERRQKKKEKTKKRSSPSIIELSKADMSKIESNRMLTDNHINKFSEMMREKYPMIQGLQNTLLGEDYMFDVCKGTFVQIIHTGSLHWITLSNMLCKNQNEVDLFDSLPTGHSPPMHVLMQIASIMMTKDKYMKVRLQPCQVQKGGVDCGLFAMANAIALCEGKDPSALFTNQSQMRPHLLKCIKNGVVEVFPAQVLKVKNPAYTTERVGIHCECRLPDNLQEKMVSCSTCNEWYHVSCVRIPQSVFDVGNVSDWICNGCTKNTSV